MHVVRIDSDVHRLVLKDRRVGPDLDGEAPFITQVYVDELLRADELNNPNSAMSVALRCRWHQAQILRPRSEHHPLARMHSVGEMTKGTWATAGTPVAQRMAARQSARWRRPVRRGIVVRAIDSLDGRKFRLQGRLALRSFDARCRVLVDLAVRSDV